VRVAVVAPDKFKGSLSAGEAAAAIERGLRSAWPDGLETRALPMADGGEGTVDAFVAAGAQRIVRAVRGPLGRPTQAAFALDGTVAVIEMSAASGLALLAPNEYDALRSTTYGTGELIAAAAGAGARRIVVGIGGSATNDGGAGALEALGVRLLDEHGSSLGPGGGALARLAQIDLAGLDAHLRDITIEVAADVDNPLLGPRGASAVFGPQKGASAEGVAQLDAALTRFADVTASTLGEDLRDRPGAGAAGGLGFALCAFLNAQSRPGVDIVADLRGLPAALAGATWCFTGEGSIDAQTLRGKTVAGVARLARAAGVPTIAFAGRIEPEAESELAPAGVVTVPIADGPMPAEQALYGAASLLERAAARTARLLSVDWCGASPKAR
jgi:glycerate kinase